MTSPKYRHFDTALLVLARRLVEEMRSHNYPKEWSRPPLNSLLQLFVILLNCHPRKLGNVLQRAYDATFPELQGGNLDQLTTGPFAKTKQYFLDEYAAQLSLRTRKKQPRLPGQSALCPVLETLGVRIVQLFAELTPAQENEHRTLERVCVALEPVFACVESYREMGEELTEYAAQWRNLSVNDRAVLARLILASWKESLEHRLSSAM